MQPTRQPGHYADLAGSEGKGPGDAKVSGPAVIAGDEPQPSDAALEALTCDLPKGVRIRRKSERQPDLT